MTSFLDHKKWRDEWVAATLKQDLAAQFRGLRREQSQAAFGRKIDRAQTNVSRFEDPNYGAMNIQTLLEVANKLDIGLSIRFIPIHDMLLPDQAFEAQFPPRPYGAEQLAGNAATGNGVPARLADRIRQCIEHAKRANRRPRTTLR